MAFSSLQEWLAAQAETSKSDLMYATRLSWSTVCRAAKGQKVSLRTARKLSRATKGQVPVHALTDDDEARLEDEPRSAA